MANAVAVKERPILFSGKMVRAILTCAKCGHVSVPFPCERCGSTEFCKTQTRRVMKPQPFQENGTWNWRGLLASNDRVRDQMLAINCPHGFIGDRLYVKEAAWLWCERRPNGTTKMGRHKWNYVPVPNTPTVYVADHPEKPDWGYPVTTRSRNVEMWKYKTARFMPRWASRIDQEIINIRVERFREISEEDAIAEGAEVHPLTGSYRDGFSLAWNRLHAKRGFGWDINPWVWVIEFRRV